MNALLLVLVNIFAQDASKGLSVFEVISSSGCKDIPISVQQKCHQNKGATKPFRYVEIRETSDCIALIDSMDRVSCQRAPNDSHYYAPLDQIASGTRLVPRKAESRKDEIRGVPEIRPIISAIILVPAVLMAGFIWFKLAEWGHTSLSVGAA